LQHPVADQVAEGVVDLLEPVQVDQGHGQPVPGAGLLGDQGDQPLVQVAAVVAGGQAVADALLPGLGVLLAQPVDLAPQLLGHLWLLVLVGVHQVQRGPQVLVGLAPLAAGGQQRGDGLVQLDQARAVGRAVAVRRVGADTVADGRRLKGRPDVPLLRWFCLGDVASQYGHRTHLPTSVVSSG
jgi:hypothetical protein